MDHGLTVSLCIQETGMANITLSVDDELIKKVRKIAIEKNTTLTPMIREFLISVADRADQEREGVLHPLDASFQTLSRDMGKRTWTREALHDRSGTTLMKP
jgi:hypothetical protein